MIYGFHISAFNYPISFQTYRICCCVTGARVILACRDMDRANKAAEEVRKRSRNDNVIVKKLDLASLQSVRQLAKEILASEERLDVLINNAGRCINHHHLSPSCVIYRVLTVHS